jgi:hypothetical protein
MIIARWPSDGARVPVNLGGGFGLYSENFEIGPRSPRRAVGLTKEDPSTHRD